MATMPAPVLLVRHGQSEWNVARRTQGQTAHPPLTALGREQAAAAARTVAQAVVGAQGVRVVSSDLVRARQTADVVAAALGVVVEEDVRLREQHLGTLEGRSYEETWAAADQHDWSDPSLPVAGGESPAAVHARMAAVVDEALELAGTGTAVVLVSHGDAVRAAVAHLRGLGPGEGEWVEVPNGAVLRADADLDQLMADGLEQLITDDPDEAQAVS